jgi:hypothetical protein
MMTRRAAQVEPRSRLARRYSARRMAGRRTGNLLAKPNDGAYVSLSHLGRFRVIDPSPASLQDDSARGTSGEN